MYLKSILWADDDDDDIILIKEAFEAEQIVTPVIWFKNGRGVIDHLTNCKKEGNHNLPSLVVLDFNMPSLNGGETLTHIRQHLLLPYLPVVIFTTSVSVIVLEHCKKYNARIYVKPNSFQEFRDRIKTLVSVEFAS